MKRHGIPVLFGMVAFLMFGGCATHKSMTPAIDPLFAEFSGEGTPGAAVMVLKSGKPVFTGTYGAANLTTGAPVTETTNFRLASFTKQFTAMAALLLVDKGTITLDTTLTAVFPDFPAYGRDINIRNLLQHTSGLVAYEDLMDPADTTQILDRGVYRLLAAVDSTYFVPETAYRYSNSGYAILANVIAKVTGKSFAEALDDLIFSPLGMDRTVAYEKGISTVPERAYGYRNENGRWLFSDQSTTSAVLGDGGIYTSLKDLKKWDKALYGGSAISEKVIKQAFTPGRLADGTPLTYGFGWGIDEYKGHRRVSHGGATCGFRTAIMRFPDERVTVIILTNRREATVERLAESVADMYLE